MTEPDDGSIKWDDRKLRYDGFREENGKYVLAVGPVHYGELQTVGNPATMDPEYFKELQRIGEKDFGDPWAYLPRIFGVNAVPVTNEGYVHVFLRGKSELSSYRWHVIGGVLDTDLTLFDREDPSQAMRQRIYENMMQELKEETGTENLSLEMTGLVGGHILSVDVTHIAYINKTSEQFLKDMENAPHKKDHVDVKVLESKKQVKDFLHGEEDLVSMGRGALELYLEKE